MKIYNKILLLFFLFYCFTGITASLERAFDLPQPISINSNVSGEKIAVYDNVGDVYVLNSATLDKKLIAKSWQISNLFLFPDYIYLLTKGQRLIKRHIDSGEDEVLHENADIYKVQDILENEGYENDYLDVSPFARLFLQNFINKEFDYEFNGWWNTSSYVSGVERHAMYLGLYPKAPSIIDDTENRRMSRGNYIAIRQNSDRVNLPTEMKNNLEELREEIGEVGRLDVFINIQPNTPLGESQDHLDENGDIIANAQTSRLRIHGWAAPDAGEDGPFEGSVLKRHFPMGIFKPEFDSIAPKREYRGNLVVGRTRDMLVHVHDNKWSPRNAWIKIGSLSQSQSFWSLAVDTENGNAVATFHMILSEEDYEKVEELVVSHEYKVGYFLEALFDSFQENQYLSEQLLNIF